MIPTQRRRTRSRHFHVTAREMLLEIPHRCPYIPGLALLGVAVTETEQHHIILELGSSTSVDRFYLGPTREQVQRRAQILAAALQQLPDVDAFHASLVQEWVLLTWESLLDEIVEQLPPVWAGSDGLSPALQQYPAHRARIGSRAWRPSPQA